MLGPLPSRTALVLSAWLVTVVPACLVSIPELAEHSTEAGSDAEAGPQDASVEADATLPEADATLPEADVDAQSEDVADQCEAGTIDCDGDMSNGCEQVLNNAEHCGRCGHDCLGGTCAGGACQPLLLANGIQNPYGLVKDFDYVYGTGDDANGQVWKVPVDGCVAPENCASLLSSGGARYKDIALDDEALFFTDKSANRVVRIQKTGGAECVLATGQQTPVGIAVDDTYVYWAAQSGNEIWRASKACASGSPPEVIIVSTPSPQLLRLDASGLYWTSLDGGLVSWASVDGTSTEPVWSGSTPGNFMFGLAMDDQWVYWREGYHLSSSGTARVARAPRDRSGTLEVLADDQVNPRYLAIDETHVYWTADDAVRRVAKAGGDVQTLAQGYPSAHGIVVDEAAVFFCTYYGGELYKVAK